MAGATEYPDLASVRKVQEIPVINTVTSSVSQLYGDVKSNRFTAWGVIAVETMLLLSCAAVMPVLSLCVNLVRGPVETVDVFICMLIDGAKSKFPVFFKPTEELTRSASKAMVSSSITQATLYGVDKVLLVAHKSVTLLPDVSVEEVVADAEDEDQDGTVSAVTSTLNPLRNLYSSATYPLRIMGRFLQVQRRKVRKLLRSSNSSTNRGRSRKRVTPRQPSPPKGIIERIVGMPVQALHWIGVLAERRTMLKLQEDPDLIITSPKTRALGSPGSENDSGNFLEQLNTSLEDYISEEDPDYEPGDSDSYSESLSEEDTPNVSQEIDASPEKMGILSPSSRHKSQVKDEHQVSPQSAVRRSRVLERNVAAHSSQIRAKTTAKTDVRLGQKAVGPNSKVKTAPARPLAGARNAPSKIEATSKAASPKYVNETASSRKKAVSSGPPLVEKPKSASPNRGVGKSASSPETTKRVGSNVSKLSQNGSQHGAT